MFVEARDPEAEAVRSAVYAHGRTPYNVGVCLIGDASMIVCVGGNGEDTADRFLPEVDAPQLVTSEPADGAVDVAVDTSEVVLHLSRALTADDHVIAQVTNVATGFDVYTPAEALGIATVDGDAVHVALPANLQPGAHFRVALTVSRGPGHYTFIGQKKPVVVFRTAGPVVDDPRFVSHEIPCPQARVDGVCDVGAGVPFAVGTVISVGVDYDEPDNDVGRPRFTDAAGVAQNVTQETELLQGNFHVQFFTVVTALQPSTPYTITFPVGARDSLGALLPPDELVYTFTTEAPP